jgi:prevent-host-death family protein
MDNSVSMAEVKAHFSEYVSRASSGERILIRRRERPMAVLISTTESERLDRAAQAGRQLANTLGQDHALLREIERGEAHPAMAAFGLWQDEDDLDALADEMRSNREWLV